MANGQTGSGRTYVLVHGAWHGGWVWKDVAKILRAAGHVVTAPTMTGLGERKHLLSPDVDLDTHVEDIVNHVEMEDLSDIVLVGWSYGGTVAVPVISRIADRLRSVVFLDAYVPEDGKSQADYSGAEGERLKRAAAAGETVIEPPSNMLLERWGLTDQTMIDFLAPRLTAQPMKTFVQPVKAALGLPEHLSLTYVKLNGERPTSFLKFYRQAQHDARFDAVCFPDGHLMMVTAPAQLSAYLMTVK
jgi:pimeloyl-ACP methyl ester carboxylesterase